MDRLIIAIVVIFIVFFSITYFLHHFFKAKRFIKYLPSLTSLIASTICIISAKNVHGEGFKDLVYVLISELLFVGFISGLISALYFDYIEPILKKK